MPILDDRNFEFFSHSPDQTRRLGIHLGGYLRPGDVVALEGNLGSGKTTLVQGVAQGWGVLDPVSSPTYVIVNEYRRADEQRLYHMDAYRLSGTFDAEILDFDRMLARGPVVVEWAERIREVLPKDLLWIRLDYTGMGHRAMMLNPQGKHFETVVENVRRKLYGAF
ncbi:tRNA (adenosine(37)-N6)-threonylcarbamoyltransferase complex ATPase subunit type 1 TsaE [Chloroflexota bacterium]|nr:tRNA (adenosine(37)-N6)-threonylcarbamoyltransferase complex ATPase subunit type 1 TsaE [Chloroflexota bacterium]